MFNPNKNNPDAEKIIFLENPLVKPSEQHSKHSELLKPFRLTAPLGEKTLWSWSTARISIFTKKLCLAEETVKGKNPETSYIAQHSSNKLALHRARESFRLTTPMGEKTHGPWSNERKVLKVPQAKNVKIGSSDSPLANRQFLSHKSNHSTQIDPFRLTTPRGEKTLTSWSIARKSPRTNMTNNEINNNELALAISLTTCTIGFTISPRASEKQSQLGTELHDSPQHEVRKVATQKNEKPKLLHEAKTGSTEKILSQSPAMKPSSRPKAERRQLRTSHKIRALEKRNTFTSSDQEEASSHRLDLIAESSSEDNGERFASSTKQEIREKFEPPTSSTPASANRKRHSSHSPNELRITTTEEATDLSESEEAENTPRGTFSSGTAAIFVKNPKETNSSAAMNDESGEASPEHKEATNIPDARLERVEGWCFQAKADFEAMQNKMEAQNKFIIEKITSLMNTINANGSQSNTNPGNFLNGPSSFAQVTRSSSSDRLVGRNQQWPDTRSQWQPNPRQSRSVNRQRSRSASSSSRPSEADREFNRGWVGSKYVICPTNYAEKSGDVLDDEKCGIIMAFLKEVIRADKANAARDQDNQLPNYSTVVSDFEFKHGVIMMMIDDVTKPIEATTGILDRIRNAFDKTDWQLLKLPNLKFLKSNQLALKDVFNTSTKAVNPCFDDIKSKLGRLHPKASPETWQLVKQNTRWLPRGLGQNQPRLVLTTFTFTADRTLSTYIRDRNLEYMYDDFDLNCGKSYIQLSYRHAPGGQNKSEKLTYKAKTWLIFNPKQKHQDSPIHRSRLQRRCTAELPERKQKNLPLKYCLKDLLHSTERTEIDELHELLQTLWIKMYLEMTFKVTKALLKKRNTVNKGNLTGCPQSQAKILPFLTVDFHDYSSKHLYTGKHNSSAMLRYSCNVSCNFENWTITEGDSKNCSKVTCSVYLHEYFSQPAKLENRKTNNSEVAFRASSVLPRSTWKVTNKPSLSHCHKNFKNPFSESEEKFLNKIDQQLKSMELTAAETTSSAVTKPVTLDDNTMEISINEEEMQIDNLSRESAKSSAELKAIEFANFKKKSLTSELNVVDHLIAVEKKKEKTKKKEAEKAIRKSDKSSNKKPAPVTPPRHNTAANKERHSKKDFLSPSRKARISLPSDQSQTTHRHHDSRSKHSNVNVRITNKPGGSTSAKRTISVEEYRKRNRSDFSFNNNTKDYKERERNRSKFNHNTDEKGYAISRKRTLQTYGSAITIKTPATEIELTSPRAAKTYYEYKEAKKRKIHLDRSLNQGRPVNEIRIEATGELQATSHFSGNLNRPIPSQDNNRPTENFRAADTVLVYDHRDHSKHVSYKLPDRDCPPNTSNKPRTARERFRNRDGIEAQSLPWETYLLINKDYPIRSIKTSEAPVISEKMGRLFKAIVAELNKERFPNQAKLPVYFKETKLKDGLIRMLFSPKPTNGSVFIGRSIFESALSDLTNEQRYTGEPFPELRIMHINELSYRIKAFKTAILRLPFANIELKDLKTETDETITTNRGVRVEIKDWHEIERNVVGNETVIKTLIDGRSCDVLNKCRGIFKFNFRILQITEATLTLEGSDRKLLPRVLRLTLQLNSFQMKQKSYRMPCPSARWTEFASRIKTKMPTVTVVRKNPVTSLKKKKKNTEILTSHQIIKKIAELYLTNELSNKRSFENKAFCYNGVITVFVLKSDRSHSQKLIYSQISKNPIRHLYEYKTFPKIRRPVAARKAARDSFNSKMHSTPNMTEITSHSRHGNSLDSAGTLDPHEPPD